MAVIFQRQQMPSLVASPGNRQPNRNKQALRNGKTFSQSLHLGKRTKHIFLLIYNLYITNTQQYFDFYQNIHARRKRAECVVYPLIVVSLSGHCPSERPLEICRTSQRQVSVVKVLFPANLHVRCESQKGHAELSKRLENFQRKFRKSLRWLTLKFGKRFSQSYHFISSF